LLPLRTSLAYVGAVVLGAAVGLTAAFTHATTVDAVGARLPLGIVVALAASGGLFAAAGVLLGRAGAALCAGGWLVTVLLMAAQRPEGDLVVTASASGWALIVGGVLLAIVTVGLARRG